jgi:hypothetical protein
MAVLDGSENGSGNGNGAAREDGLSFEQWRGRFLTDAKSQGILHTAEQLGDVALRLFWEMGVAPSVRALLASVEKDHLTQ